MPYISLIKNNTIISNEGFTEDSINLIESPKASGFWSVPWIYVLDNWSLTNQTYPWCSGSGTYSDPYIIENVTTTSNIQGGHCIMIQNSEDYFTIRNCTLSTTAALPTRYGIALINVQNGTIIDNQIKNNAGSGITLTTGCENTTVIDNEITGNTYRGVYVTNNNKNNIILNNISNNGRNGIYLDGVSNYNITTNDITNNGVSGTYYGIYGVNSNDNIIHDNDILRGSNQESGIYFFSNCDDNNITSNTIDNHFNEGVHLISGSERNRIEGNDMTLNNYGIIIEGTSEDNQILGNSLTRNSNRAIYIHTSNNTIIRDNIIDGQYFQSIGMVIYQGSSHTEIVNNTVHHCNTDGIILWQSVLYTKVINNTIYDNLQSGIYMNANVDPVSNNYIFNNTIRDNSLHGIHLFEGSSTGDYNEIYNNTIYTNNGHGIFLESPPAGVGHKHNRIINNTIYDSQFVAILVRRNSFNTTIISNKLLGLGSNGIQIEDGSGNSTIVDNYLIDHYVNGISIIGCNYTNVLNNTVINCLQDALTLTTTFNCTVDNNTLIDNKGYGIKMHNGGQENNITNNNIINSNKTGIYITDNCDYNLIKQNLIYNSTDYGLLIDVNDCQNNLIYLNKFIDNTINAYDNSTNNSWDNGTIGNYWDDYTGCDSGGDGIGEDPYVIPGDGGSQDNKPIQDEDCSTNGGPGNGKPGGIPFGDYYLIFIFVSVISLVFIERKRRLKQI
jgi:parallel beta-helix repeat protein